MGPGSKIDGRRIKNRRAQDQKKNLFQRRPKCSRGHLARVITEAIEAIMILYFSATGNTRFVAEQLAKQLCDETLDLFSRIRNKDYSEIYSEKPFVICSPIYLKTWREYPHPLQVAG